MDSGKTCPMSGKKCSMQCAWLVEGECAVKRVASEMFLMVESYMVANRLNHQAAAEGNDNKG